MPLKTVFIADHHPEIMIRCFTDRWSIDIPANIMAAVVRDDGDTLIVTCEVDGHNYIGRVPKAATRECLRWSSRWSEEQIPELLQRLADIDAKDAAEKDLVGQTKALLSKLTAEQRAEALAGYCRYCFGDRLPCHCENDE